MIMPESSLLLILFWNLLLHCSCINLGRFFKLLSFHILLINFHYTLYLHFKCYTQRNFTYSRPCIVENKYHSLVKFSKLRFCLYYPFWDSLNWKIRLVLVSLSVISLIQNNNMMVFKFSILNIHYMEVLEKTFNADRTNGIRTSMQKTIWKYYGL